jgi:hypothetical protein
MITPARQDWFTLSKDIRHLDVGGVVVSRSAAALFNTSYQTGGIFLKTWDIATDDDFSANCVGAQLASPRTPLPGSPLMKESVYHQMLHIRQLPMNAWH